MNSQDYPRLSQIGVEVNFKPYPYVNPKDLNKAMLKNNLDINKFNELFGIQTMIVINGKGCPYPWDVEAVLERMMSGRLTGTQLIMD
jgi:hypothetical protein